MPLADTVDDMKTLFEIRAAITFSSEFRYELHSNEFFIMQMLLICFNE